MKQCVICRAIYNNDYVYCLKDGESLVDFQTSPAMENDDEAETVFNHPPIVVEIEPNPVLNNIPPPISAMPFPSPAIKQTNAGKYIVFLLIGILSGGVLAFGAVWFIINLTLSRERITKQETPALKNLPKPTSGKDLKNNDDALEKKPLPKGYNGRVIAANAIVREAPTTDSAEVGTVSFDEPIKIGKTASPNSPWFRVSTYTGFEGWMHGNTIEFAK